MSDWLADLRQEKQEAIERARARAAAGQNGAAAGELESESQRLAALVQSIGIEPLLKQFVEEVLRDHPLFVDPSLNRTVMVRAAGGGVARDEQEGAPWSGPVEGNFLPAALDLPGGRVVSRIDWRVHLRHHGQHSDQLHVDDLLITASTQGVQVNMEMLTEPTVEKFKAALVTAFRETTQPAHHSGARRIRRRHRRWYKRLWDRLFPANQPSRVYSALIMLVLLILAVVVSVLSMTFVRNIGIR